MTALPSFVELMASLGLDQATPESEQSPSPPSSTCGSPKLESDTTAPASPMRARSSPSLRDAVSRQRVTRYSPYSPGLSFARRGSLSSVSSSSSGDCSPTRETFTSASVASSRSRRPRNKLCLNIYGSTSDLPANMPISTYVRRKTPATSPTSPTFPRDTGCDFTSDIPMPLTIPVLPTLLPNSASSESFPITPNDSEICFSGRISPPRDLKPFPDFTEGGRYSHHLRHFTGVRISTSSRHSLNEQYLRRNPVAEI